MPLLGTSDHVLDDKNRVAIPARWRDQFDAPAYLTSGAEKCVAVYTKGEFEAASAEVVAIPASSQEGRDRRRKFFGDTRDVAKDAQGRPKGGGIARGRIHVCDYPWKVTRSEPAELLPKGVTGVAVRKGPEPDAPIIYKNGQPCVIRIGGIYARQSERQSDRTGGEANNCPAPPIRAPRGVDQGFVWGCPLYTSLSPRDRTRSRMPSSA